MPAFFAIDVSIKLMVSIVENWRDDSDLISVWSVLLPNGEVPVSEVLSTRASVDMQNILPRWRSSVCASNFRTYSELLEASCCCDLVAGKGSDHAVVDVGFAAVKTETGVDWNTWWGDVWFGCVPEVSDLEKRRWRVVRVRGVDCNWARVRVERVDDVASECFSILVHGQFKHVAFNFLLGNTDRCPSLILAVNPVFNFIEVVAFHWPVELEATIGMLPDGEVSVSELISAGSSSHVDDALPAMARGLLAEDVDAGGVNGVSIDGSDDVAPLGRDRAAIDEHVAVIAAIARILAYHWRYSSCSWSCSWSCSRRDSWTLAFSASALLSRIDDPVAIDEECIVRSLEISFEDHAGHEVSVSLEVDLPHVVVANFGDAGHGVVPCLPNDRFREFNAYKIA